MITAIVMVVLMIIGAGLQVLFPALPFLGQAKPPFLLAIVLYYALNRTPGTVLLAGLVAGLLHDLLTEVPLGYSSIVFVLVGVVAGRFRNLVLPDSRVTAGFFGMMGSLAAQVLLYAMLVRIDAVWWPFGRLTVRLLWGALLAAVVTPLTFIGARRCDQWVGIVKVREVIDGIEQPMGW
ncbi:MAG: rod shape-determining protein MreD [Kiritimatiellae bacterium]|nr:rod shape-determining protein MreD [Kiritimatiellia bacterium]